MVQYDSRQDTKDHIAKVGEYIDDMRENLSSRATWHDSSKLEDPEKAGFDEWTPKLRDLVYDSPEYKEALAGLGVSLQHHYRNNSHHPEHYSDGISGMSLLDVVEMLCDWFAATQRHATGDLASSIEKNIVRFSIEPQLANILRNTAKEMGWI